MGDDTFDAKAALHGKKYDEPFSPFEITTHSGNRILVGGRWLFAFNDTYVLIRDERDRGTRVWFKGKSFVSSPGRLCRFERHVRRENLRSETDPLTSYEWYVSMISRVKHSVLTVLCGENLMSSQEPAATRR